MKGSAFTQIKVGAHFVHFPSISNQQELEIVKAATFKRVLKLPFITKYLSGANFWVTSRVFPILSGNTGCRYLSMMMIAVMFVWRAPSPLGKTILGPLDHVAEQKCAEKSPYVMHKSIWFRVVSSFFGHAVRPTHSE